MRNTCRVLLGLAPLLVACISDDSMPADGETVTSPVRIAFGIEGMSVVPAGDDATNSGYFRTNYDSSRIRY